ncbi:uncharacterized protein BXZ73DRAFT_104909 [Epithele typhae]|uniref:uncharacterized protein n=1 Tax=Epithele typhae TaxID=378194 RepID=UPI002008B6AA|nr:uncharacterized protein BXZ73DRAFT_104909 [Epithele typhae]KAH9919801.1 hypothetical protein BXZ73DRAFT_104909 [Epithele typhae]
MLPRFGIGVGGSGPEDAERKDTERQAAPAPMHSGIHCRASIIAQWVNDWRATGLRPITLQLVETVPSPLLSVPSPWGPEYAENDTRRARAALKGLPTEVAAGLAREDDDVERRWAAPLWEARKDSGYPAVRQS